MRIRTLLLTGCILSGMGCDGGSVDPPPPSDPDPDPEPVRYSFLHIGGMVTDSTGTSRKRRQSERMGTASRVGEAMRVHSRRGSCKVHFSGRSGIVLG